jgi:hypothetical protein
MLGNDGHIEQLQLISGHPLLVRAAREAVRQWIFRPTLPGGEPVRVTGRIQVAFWLDVRKPSALPVARGPATQFRHPTCWQRSKSSFSMPVSALRDSRLCAKNRTHG